VSEAQHSINLIDSVWLEQSVQTKDLDA